MIYKRVFGSNIHMKEYTMKNKHATTNVCGGQTISCSGERLQRLGLDAIGIRYARHLTASPTDIHKRKLACLSTFIQKTNVH